MRENTDQNNSKYGHFSRSITLNHYIIKVGRCLSIDKLTSKELCQFFLLNNNKKPPLAKYLQKLFKNNNLEWSFIYLLPQMATIDTYLRSIQCKIVNNTLRLNKKFFTLELKNSALFFS